MSCEISQAKHKTPADPKTVQASHPQAGRRNKMKTDRHPPMNAPPIAHMTGSAQIPSDAGKG